MKKVVSICFLLIFVIGGWIGFLYGYHKVKKELPSSEIREQDKTVLEDESLEDQQVFEETQDFLKGEEVNWQREEEIVPYFENLEKEVEEELAKPMTENRSNKLKNTFVHIVDFLFYDEPIGGVTFDSLTEQTKQKLLAIFSSIDQKIEKKLPGYKETIQATGSKWYHNVTDKIHQQMTSFDHYLETNMDPDIYQSLQDGVGSLKDGFSNATDVMIDTGKEIKESIKNWYETFRK